MVQKKSNKEFGRNTIAKIIIYFFFILHSSYISMWGLSIPTLQAKLSLSNFSLALLIAILPFGSLLGSRLSSIVRIKDFVFISGLFYLLGITTLLISTNLLLLSIILFFTGLASVDLMIRMNQMAVNYESKSSQNVLGKCHSFYSFSMLLTLLLGNLFIGFVKSYEYLVYGMTIFFSCCLIMLFYVNKQNLAIVIESDHTFYTKSIKSQIDRSIDLLIFLVIGFFAMMIENVIFNWIGVFSIQDKGFYSDQSGTALLIFVLAMFIGRSLLDFLRRYFSDRHIFFCGICISFLGQLLIVLFTNIYLFVFGVFILGFGISFLIPILYKASNNYSSFALSYLTGAGILAFLITPLVIGLISEFFSLKRAFLFCFLCFSIISYLFYKRIIFRLDIGMSSTKVR